MSEWREDGITSPAATSPLRASSVLCWMQTWPLWIYSSDSKHLKGGSGGQGDQDRICASVGLDILSRRRTNSRGAENRCARSWAKGNAEANRVHDRMRANPDDLLARAYAGSRRTTDHKGHQCLSCLQSSRGDVRPSLQTNQVNLGLAPDAHACCDSANSRRGLVRGTPDCASGKFTEC